MNYRFETLPVTFLAALLLAGFPLQPATGGDVPAKLPDPDGKPGDTTKPVKVYILAGQSNMVGMGDLSGAKNRYAGVFLTADPDAPLGPLYLARALNDNRNLLLSRGFLDHLGLLVARFFISDPIAS